jgi:hypothetical protein
VVTGSAASGAGGNRDIPPEEGGSYDDRGRLSKARDFEGTGGPEDKIEQYAQENPGNDDIRENIQNQSKGHRDISWSGDEVGRGGVVMVLRAYER